MTTPLRFAVEDEIRSKDYLVSADGITRYRSSEDGSIYSVYPPTAFLGFGYWYHMVPPFKPKSVLMLGYAGGTVAGLIRLIWGNDVPITAVDIAPITENRYGVELVRSDARDFVRFSRTYEVVLMDLYVGKHTPAFVMDPQFVAAIHRITERLLIIYADPDANIGIYEQLLTRIRLMDFHHKMYFFQPQGRAEDFLVR